MPQGEAPLWGAPVPLPGLRALAPGAHPQADPIGKIHTSSLPVKTCNRSPTCQRKPMILSTETITKKKIELEEALAQREATAEATEALKEELKEQRAILARLDSEIRKLALEVATERGEGDQLSISVSLSAADRTAPLPLEPPAVAAVEEEDPKPAPVDGPSDADVRRALLRVLEQDAQGWHGEGEIFATVAESFPAECRPGYSQISRMLTDLQRSGRVEIWNETEGENIPWKVIPKATKKAPKKKGRR